jgi:hypothetical protein
MSLVVWSLWINTKTWNLTAKNLNVIYYNDNRFIVLLDNIILKRNGIDSLFSLENSLKKVYVDYPIIYFITKNVDTPFLSYNLNTRKLNYYDIKGTFSDFSTKSKILLASSNYYNSQSYSFSDSLYYQKFGYRIVEIFDKKLYIDKNNNLRDFESDKILFDDVFNVSKSMNYLIVFKSNSVIILDERLNEIKRIYGRYSDGFLIDLEDDGNNEIVLYDEKRVSIFRDYGDVEIVYNSNDSIKCVIPLDYNNDGSYDFLISTKKEIKLFEQMPKTNLEIEKLNYPIIETKCGCLWGMTLTSQKLIKQDPFSIKIKYQNDGIELKINNEDNEFVIIKLLDAKGSVIKIIYSGKFKGVKEFKISDLQKTGVYIISIEGEKNKQKTSFIWSKK